MTHRPYESGAAGRPSTSFRDDANPRVDIEFADNPRSDQTLVPILHAVRAHNSLGRGVPNRWRGG
jgi:hypothetical protein